MGGGGKKRKKLNISKATLSPSTLQREGPQDQCVAVLGGPQRPGLAPDAPLAAAGGRVGRGAHHNRALHVHRVMGPQELEGSE